MFIEDDSNKDKSIHQSDAIKLFLATFLYASTIGTYLGSKLQQDYLNNKTETITKKDPNKNEVNADVKNIRGVSTQITN